MTTSSHWPAGNPGTERSSNYFEYWPDPVFYFPVIVCYLLLALRYKSLTLPSVVNPEFPDGKCAILDLIPGTLSGWVGRYAHFQPGNYSSGCTDAAKEFLADSGLTYPVVIKPDMGLKGIDVELLNNSRDLENYFMRQNGPGDFQFQEYIDWPGEAGVFYIRMPGAARGSIISIAFKSPAAVTGDGISTLKALIEEKKIPRLQKRLFLNRNSHQLGRVIKKGETVPLMFARNHDQGGVYIDGQAQITTELSSRFDEIARAIPNFYYGRFDVKFKAMDTFTKGRQFKIIEINGTTSEAGHIYDADARLRDVYPFYFRRLNRMFAISAANYRRGYRPKSLKMAIAHHKETFKFIKKGLQT